VDQIERAGNVGVDHMADLLEILIEKGVAQPVTSIGKQRLDRSPFDGG
jgi:hypothetical protein